MSSSISEPPHFGEFIEFQGRLYQIGEPIGRGYFGTVYACADEWGNSLVAKVLLPQDGEYEQVREEWLHELTNLLRLRHPNITFAFDAFEYKNAFYLILERCNSSLKDLIAWPELIGEVWLLPIARCVLQALGFIHRTGYVHKDLHPGNVLYTRVRNEMNPRDLANTTGATVFKVCDLGISRLAPEIDIFNTILAEWMLPPEFLDSDEYGVIGPQVDIYHSGLLFLTLLLGKTPEFTREEILEGVPRQTAESLDSKFSPVIAKALRRHVHWRTQTPLEFWKELSGAA